MLKRVSICLESETLETLDKTKGDVSRSRFLARLIENHRGVKKHA